MTSMNKWWGAAIAAICLTMAGCPTDEVETAGANDEDEDDEDEDDGDTEPSTTLPPTASSSVSGSSSSTTTESDSDTTGDPPDSDTTTTSDSESESATTTSGDPPDTDDGTSTGIEDIDIECMGPPGDDTCDAPSPYDGVGDCDPYAQDCEDGEKCMPWANDGGNSWNATRCSPVDPAPVALDGVCTVEGSGVSGVDNCDVGLMCWDVDVETNMGTCVELCGCGPDEPTCAGGGTFCSISNMGALPICLPTCDPLESDECNDGQGCYFVNNVFQCAPDASGGDGEAGDPCEFVNVCDPGLFCAGAALIPGCASPVGCCTEFCDTDEGNGACTVLGTECVALFPAGMEPEECHLDTGGCVEP